MTLLGYPSLPLKLEKEGRQLSNVSVNYTLGTDLTPICMGVETHCLKRGLQSWLSIVKEPEGTKTHFFFLICISDFFFFFTLQYCIGFAIHQHASTTGVHVCKYCFLIGIH